MAETPREPDHYEEKAREIYAEPAFVFAPIAYIAAALRATEADALERAAQWYDARNMGGVARTLRALASPAAAPAAETDNMDRCSQISQHRRCTLLRDHRGDHAYPAPPSEPVAPAPDLRVAWTAMKMVDDAYWGDFCGCCGVILSLESQDEECGPQHTAVQLVHEWLEKHPEQPQGGAGEGT